MRLALASVLVASVAVVSSAAAEDGSKKASGTISSKMHLNDLIAFPLGAGCQYLATIQGTVEPVKGSSTTVEPKLVVDATFACPNGASRRVTENVSGTGPLTMEELEEALERRATVVSDASGVRCAYTPELELERSGLTAPAIHHLCPTGGDTE